MCNENITAAFLKKAFDQASLRRGQELIERAPKVFGAENASYMITSKNLEFGRPLLEMSIESGVQHRQVMAYLSRLEHKA